MLTAVIATYPQITISAESEATPDQVVNALEKVFGVHQVERRNHIKGTCATGEFVGSKDAAPYSRSALFSGKAVPVVARFSLAGDFPTRIAYKAQCCCV